MEPREWRLFNNRVQTLTSSSLFLPTQRCRPRWSWQNAEYLSHMNLECRLAHPGLQIATVIIAMANKCKSWGLGANLATCNRQSCIATFFLFGVKDLPISWDKHLFTSSSPVVFSHQNLPRFSFLALCLIMMLHLVCHEFNYQVTRVKNKTVYGRRGRPWGKPRFLHDRIP